MPLVEWTPEEHAALKSGYQRKVARLFAFQCEERLDKIHRDILSTAKTAQAWLTNGKHPAVVADYAKTLAVNAMQRDIAPFTPELMPYVYQCGAAVFGYTQDEIDASLRVLRAAIDRLAATADDGSTIAADVADVLEQFVSPPSLW